MNIRKFWGKEMKGITELKPAQWFKKEKNKKRLLKNPESITDGNSYHRFFISSHNRSVLWKAALKNFIKFKRSSFWKNLNTQPPG